MFFFKIIKLLKELNLKTVYFNFKYLSFKQALFLPIFVSKNVKLRRLKGSVKLDFSIKPRSIRIGYPAVGIFDHRRSKSIWDVEGVIIFKGKAFIGHGSKISVGKNARIIFGNNFAITAETSIVASERKIEFGENCLLSWDVLLLDSDFHKIFNQNGKLLNIPNDISIGHNVWIGCRTTILKGSVISDGVVIASNSLVSGVIKEGKCIYGGIPLKLLKSNIRWEI